MTERRITIPIQTLKDLALTGGIEEIAAADAILIEGGELKRDGPYCGQEVECITGVSAVPGDLSEITLGHTIRFEDERPLARLVTHEMQHVYDIENVSPLIFYTTYGVQALFTDYEDRYWERRAQTVEEGYGEGVRPRGWPW